MINIDNLWKFVTEELSSGEKLSARKEAWIEIIDRLRQSEKDAARYRWLRDEARYHMDGGPLVFMTNYDGDPVAYQDCGMVLYDSYLDSAIEEAMSDSKA